MSYLSMMPCCQRVVEFCLYSSTIGVSFWLICALCIKSATDSLTTKLLLVLEFGVDIEVSFKLVLTRGVFFCAKPNVFYFVVELKA